jgi:quinol monooxygenase YgiN
VTMQIVRITLTRALPGNRPRVVDAFKAYIPHVRDELQTLAYTVSLDDNNADQLWLFQHYSDSAAFDEHVQSPAHAAFLEDMLPLVVHPNPIQRIPCHVALTLEK